MNTKPIPGYLWFIVALPFVYLAHRYPELPATVPIHYNLRGEADSWAPKITLWIIPFVLPLLNLFMMHKFVPLLDFDNSIEKMGGKYEKLSSGIVALVSLLACYIIMEAGNEQLNSEPFLYIILGVLLAYFGNFFPVLRPNHFIGIRVPWTLNNKDNWKKTHRLGGKMWIVGGIIIALGGILLPAQAAMILLLFVIFVICLVPVVYSYRLHRNDKPEPMV
jgi:uncharacterized membrane protein